MGEPPAPSPSRADALFLSLAQLYNMETRPKSDPSFEALGNMDELNACLALAVEHSAAAGNGLSEMLLTIQSLIIDASALVATPRDSSSARKINRTEFPTWCTDQLEVGAISIFRVAGADSSFWAFGRREGGREESWDGAKPHTPSFELRG